jgi:phosphotransferase system HPr-like phosphotransfer protein
MKSDFENVMSNYDAALGSGPKNIYVTLTGLPLSFHLEWPFHKSTSGADFFVLHADIQLENSAGLHARVAVNLSATVREVLPSLEPKDIEVPVINALRKEVDRRQLEFVKSGKLVPVQFSSRHYDFKRSKWMFGKASDDEMTSLLARKVYWQTRLEGGAAWIADPTEALYVETSSEHLLGIAKKLETQGLVKMEGQWATAASSLMTQAEKFEADMRAALEELEKKHAFERG